MRVLAVSHTSPGMRHDRVVLAQALRTARPDAELLALDVPASAPAAAAMGLPAELKTRLPVDVAVFLEHLPPNPAFFTESFARRRIFIPNLEWLQDLDRQGLASGRLDAILYKNTAAAAFIEPLPGVAAIPLRPCVGWTSVDLHSGRLDAPRFDRFLHVRGVSPQKQTEVVIDTWIRNPQFPRLTVSVNSVDGFAVPHPLSIGDHIELHLRRMAPEELRDLQQSHGIHVAPSFMEGFGHTLNEARSCGAVLVTTDAEPMRSLVRAGETGLLVPVHPQDISLYGWVPAYRIRAEQLAAVIDGLLCLPLDKRRAMGHAARSAYLADRAAFFQAIAEVLDRLLCIA